MAVIEVSEESLLLIAGDEVLGQAARLVDSGLVADVRLRAHDGCRAGLGPNGN